MRRLLLAGLLMVCACSGSQPVAPTAPSKPTPPAPPPDLVLTGHVTAAVEGQALGGLTVDLASHQATTDGSGAFRVEAPPGTLSATPLLTISGSSIVTRMSLINFTASRDLATDAISTAGSFDLDFYRELVRDNHDSPGVLRLLRRWDYAPHVYIRTVDDAGSPIDSMTLDTVQAALNDVAEWTGGRIGLAGIERGTETREGQAGWITVKWPAMADPDVCGFAQVAESGGWISLDYKNDGCTCSNRTRISPRIVRHELGHAMGFWHTGNPDDLMYFGTWYCSQDDQHPSARERFHAALAYDRPNGNSDPDTDPSTNFLRTGPPIVVVN